MLYRSKSTGRMVIVSEMQRRQNWTKRRVERWWRSLDGHVRHGEQGHAWMVTLTYRHDEKWEPRQITEFIQRIKHKSGMKAYCWIAAVQPGTGRVHYHMIVVGSRPAWVANRWPYGRTQVRPAWSVGYLLKYYWTQEVEGLPKGIRRFAVWVRAGLLEDLALWVWELSKLPAWVARYCVAWGGGLASRRDGGLWELDCGITLEQDWVRL